MLPRLRGTSAPPRGGPMRRVFIAVIPARDRLAGARRGRSADHSMRSRRSSRRTTRARTPCGPRRPGGRLPARRPVHEHAATRRELVLTTAGKAEAAVDVALLHEGRREDGGPGGAGRSSTDGKVVPVAPKDIQDAEQSGEMNIYDPNGPRREGHVRRTSAVGDAVDITYRLTRSAADPRRLLQRHLRRSSRPSRCSRRATPSTARPRCRYVAHDLPPRARRRPSRPRRPRPAIASTTAGASGTRPARARGG